MVYNYNDGVIAKVSSRKKARSYVIYKIIGLCDFLKNGPVFDSYIIM